MANTERKRKSAILSFEIAKLVIVDPVASYIELAAATGGGGDIHSNKCCAFCSKTNAHDHDITGKVKFEPKHKSYLVSLLDNKKNLPTAPLKSTKKSSSLDIFPVEKSTTLVAPKKARQRHIQPRVVSSEAEGAKYFAQQLRKSNVDDDIMAAVKILANEQTDTMQMMHLMKCSMSSAMIPAKCGKCQENAFETLAGVQLHFRDVHQVDVNIRDIIVNEQSAEDLMTELNQSANFKCNYCSSQTFTSDEARIKHVNEVHFPSKQVARLQCPQCLQLFKNASTFRKHQHSKDKPEARKHNCHLCNKSFLKQPHLRAHIQTHMGAKLYNCEVCDKRYANKSSLKDHQMNAHQVGGSRPSCQKCNKSFYNKSILRKHILEAHDKDPRFECSTCGTYFLRKANLEAHVSSTHGDGKENHCCKLCSKSYGSQERLEEHLRTSHGILPWNKVKVLQVTSKPHEIKEGQEKEEPTASQELAGTLKCRYCEQVFLPAEMESHLRFSHGVMPLRSGVSTELSITEAAEALLKTLTPQPDYLLRSLTPLPMETLDELIMDSALSKE